MKKISLILLMLLWSMSSTSAPLSSNMAFPLKITALKSNIIKLDWSLPAGYFLYKKSIHVNSYGHTKLLLNALPLALVKHKPDGSIQEIYRDHLQLIVTTNGRYGAKDLLTVAFQGCSDAGYCYPPMKVKYSLHQNIESYSGKLWQLLVFYGFGLLLSFTPCVLPMIPILSGLIVGQKKTTSTRKAFFLSLSYVLSMSIMYSLIGGLIALMGTNLQLTMQAPIVIYAFSGLCFVMGLAMFDLYQFKLPLFCQRFLAKITKHQHGGEYLGAAIMGALSILILSPCVTAPMIGALGYVAQSGSSWFGLCALFTLGLGMGTPLLIIGTSAGKILPKAGSWMNVIKHFFGLMFFALGLHLIARFLPHPLSMAFWAVLLMYVSLSMHPFRRAANARDTIIQTFGIIGFIYSILLLIGASLGNQNPWLPLASANAVKQIESPDNRVTSIKQMARSLEQAHGKPVMAYFYAEWCSSCKWVHERLLTQVKLQQALKSFVVLQVDITKQNINSAQLRETYSVIAPPTFIFFNAQGQEKTALRIAGETSANNLLKHLQDTNSSNL